VSVEVGERLETMAAVKSRLVSWGQSGCTHLIAAHLSSLVPGGSLHGVNWAGGSVLWNGNRSLGPRGPEIQGSAGKKSWCRRRDLNPHGLRHTPLKRACLPFHHFGI
jgi:hypothetical protein